VASGSWSSAPLRSRRVAVRWDRQRAGGTCTRAPALVDAVVALELAGLPLPTVAVATGLRRDNQSEAPDYNSPHQAKVHPGAAAAGPPRCVRWQPRGRVPCKLRELWRTRRTRGVASGEILCSLPLAPAPREICQICQPAFSTPQIQACAAAVNASTEPRCLLFLYARSWSAAAALAASTTSCASPAIASASDPLCATYWYSVPQIPTHREGHMEGGHRGVATWERPHGNQNRSKYLANHRAGSGRGQRAR
jgi:hypothetical protein